MNEQKTYFEDVKYRDYDFMSIFYNTEADYIPTHWHLPIEIIVPVENTYSVFIENQTYYLKEGDILIINSGVLHSINAEKEGVWFLVQLSLAAFEGKNLITPLSINFPPVVYIQKSNEALYVKVIRIINKIRNLHEERNSLAEITMFSLLLELMIEVANKYETTNYIYTTASEPSANKNIIDNVCNYITENYAEEMRLEQIATLSGFSKYHFSRLFTKYAGDSFYKYVNKVRLRNAELMLSDHSASITDICYACGFPNMQSFIRLFKQNKGYTPSEFRKLMGDM